jgi:hypothetical protein
MLAWAIGDKCTPLYHYATATNMHWMGPRAELDAIDNRKITNTSPLVIQPYSCP